MHYISIDGVVGSTNNIKQKLCFLVCGIFLFGFWIFMYADWEAEMQPIGSRFFSLKDSWSSNEIRRDETNMGKEFLINQPGCRIPGMNVFGPRVSEYVKPSYPIYCQYQIINENLSSWRPALVDDGRNFLRVNSSVLKYYGKQRVACNFQSFRRPLLHLTKAETKIEDLLEYLPTPKKLNVNTETVIEAESDEFVKVTCSETTKIAEKPFYTDYFAFVPLKGEVEHRCAEFDRHTNVDRLSVVIVGLDAVSRLNFRRQMKTSTEYLLRKLDAIEMRGYNKLGDNTFPNLVPLLMNLSVDELKRSCWPTEDNVFDDCPLIWKTFEEFGFRTIFAEDSPWIGVFNYIKNGFRRQPTDYYLRPFYYEAESKIGSQKPGNSYLCIGSRLSLAVLLNYAYKHVHRFSHKNYFGFFWSTSLTHDYFNLPQQGDAVLLSFLRRIREENLLNKTVLIVLSDHGLRWGDFRETFQGHLEERLPLLMFVFPPWFRKKYAKAIENLVSNANKLTTHFDLHETLLDFTNLTRLQDNELSRRSLVAGSRSQSLFLAVSGNRTCSQLGIPKHYCTCHDDVREINVTDSRVLKATTALENYMNKLLESHRECARLKIISVESATVERWTMGGKFSTDEQWYSDYVISVKTYPGSGLFEATVRYDYSTNFYAVIGQVSRINTYGTQSFCVNNAILKLYCYCRS